MPKKAEFRFYQIPNGEDVLALLGGNWIREYSVDADGKNITVNHFHNLLEIGICRWGEGKVVFDTKEYTYTEGTIIIIPKNYPHNTINVPGEKSFWEYIYINPTDFLMDEYGYSRREAEKKVAKIEQRPIQILAEKVPILKKELDCIMDQVRQQGYGYRKCIKGLVYAILMEIIKINWNYGNNHMDSSNISGIEKSDKLKLATDYINEHYADVIKISDISDAAYISESYLRRLFSENYDMSPLHYVNFVRISYACKIMKNSSKNISEVAQEVGFENLSTFINNFKKIVSETPKQWLKTNTLNSTMTTKYPNNAQRGWQ